MDTRHDDDFPAGSRYREVSRRLFLRRSAQAAGVLAIMPVLSACGDDATVFTSTTGVPGDGAAAVTTAVTTTSVVETTSATPTSTATAPTAGGGSLSGEAVIAFSYTASDGGARVRNPYVAVWVEDADGDLVDSISLWFLQSQKGLRWISDLRRWYSVDGSSATIDAVSSATRRPGDYAVVWDLTDIDGAPVAAGEYFFCIEAAREHGPYSLIRESVVLESGMGSITFADDGELHDATLSLVA